MKLDEDEAIINAGMYFQCMTGFLAVLYRVTIFKQNIEEHKRFIDELISFGKLQRHDTNIIKPYLEKYSKFTLAFF